MMPSFSSPISPKLATPLVEFPLLTIDLENRRSFLEVERLKKVKTNKGLKKVTGVDMAANRNEDYDGV
jgi:hypothetical protein